MGTLHVQLGTQLESQDLTLIFENSSATDLYDVDLTDVTQIQIKDDTGRSYRVDRGLTLTNAETTEDAMAFTVIPGAKVNRELRLTQPVYSNARTLRVILNKVTCPGAGRTPIKQCHIDIVATR